MKLIARKPCNVGGRQFYVGDEIPAELVLNAKMLEQYGRISIVESEGEASSEQLAALFTQEQVDRMVAEAVAELEQKREELQQAVAELKEFESGAYDGVIQISVKGESDGENGQITAVPATPEEIQQAFSIMQLNATEGAEAIADVKSENVLILLHAADSRKTIKEAAKKQADNLFSTKGESNEANAGNEPTGTDKEGADT